MNKLFRRIQSVFRAWLVAKAVDYANDRGYRCFTRAQLYEAANFFGRLELRCKKIGGGNASKVRNRNKAVRRAASRACRYFSNLARG